MKHLATLIILFCSTQSFTNVFNLTDVNFDEFVMLHNKSDEEIHDYLIIHDWKYVKSNSEGSRKAIVGMETQEKVYINDSNDIQLKLENKFHYLPKSQNYKLNRQERKLTLYTKSPVRYKDLLKNVYSAGFKVSGKENHFGNIEIASSEPEELAKRIRTEFVNTQTSSKSYIKNNFEIQLITKVYEKEIDGNMTSFNTFVFEVNL